MQEIEPGFYRHFKGQIYEVIGTGTHSETGEQFVIYKSVEDEKFWIRPVEMFFQEVDKPEYEYKGPRFVKVD
jgi:hypothetical protein